jgi:hypothetical protein
VPSIFNSLFYILFAFLLQPEYETMDHVNNAGGGERGVGEGFEEGGSSAVRAKMDGDCGKGSRRPKRRLDERMDDVETTYSYFHVFVLHFSVDKEESKKFNRKKKKKKKKE